MNKNEEEITLLGKNIIYLCKKKGIKRRQLAQYVGITQTSLSRYIYGIRTPKYYIVSIIAAYFNTTVDKITNEDLTEINYDIKEVEKSIDEYFNLVYYNAKEISERLTPEQKLKLISAIL